MLDRPYDHLWDMYYDEFEDEEENDERTSETLDDLSEVNNMDKYQNGWEDFYCPTCNCHSLGYYQNVLCPVCGTKMQKIGYTITQDKNGGEYTVKVKQKVT